MTAQDSWGPLQVSRAEEDLPRRLTQLRLDRGWTYEETAQRLGEVGCPLHFSAIYKMEKGSPRRRSVSTQELVAFSAIFKTSPNELLTPIDDDRELAQLLLERDAAIRDQREARERYFRAVTKLDEYPNAPHGLTELMPELTYEPSEEETFSGQRQEAP